MIMKLFKRLSGLIFGLFLLTAAGDWMNLPLWPIDYLNPMIPVEFVFELQNFEVEQQQDIFNSSSGIEMSIMNYKTNTLIQELNSDTSGVIRTVLPLGTFGIKAYLSSVYDSAFYQFTQPSSPQIGNSQGYYIFTIERGKNQFRVPLQRLAVVPDALLRDNLQLNLEMGRLDAALIVAKSLEPNIIADVRRLLQCRADLEQLSASAYNSRLLILREILSIYKKYGAVRDPKLIVQRDLIHIPFRIEALIKSRDKVITSVLQIIDEYMNDDRWEAALEQWKPLVKNADLFSVDSDLQSTNQSDLAYYAEIMPDVEDYVITILRDQFVQGVNLYNGGDVENARTEFTHLLTYLRNSTLDEDYPDLADDVSEYLDDISLITASGEAARDNRLDDAIMMLDTILHQNEFITRRLEEAENFLQIRGLER